VGRDGRWLLKVKITAEVDGVLRDLPLADVGKITRQWDAPTPVPTRLAAETDAKRFSALVKALTGEEPRVYRVENGKRIRIECYEKHLKGFARFAEFAEAIEEWLEETGR
jgi:hypothetical protein